MSGYTAALDKQKETENLIDQKNKLLEREITYMEIGLVNTARETLAGGQAAVLSAQGSSFAANRTTNVARIQGALGLVGADAASFFLTGTPPTDMMLHMAELNAAGQAQQANDIAEKRDKDLRLNQLHIQTQFSKQGLIAAEQFTARQFGASRTTTMIAGIQAQALQQAAELEHMPGNTEAERAIRTAAAGAQVAGLKLTEYQVQHRYDRGYGEVRDVYQTKKEGYTQTNGMLDTTAIVAAIEKVITVINSAGGGGMPPLSMGS
jgi:hypothetical protein